MNQLLLHNGKVMLDAGVLVGGVLVRDGRIAHVFPEDRRPAGLSASETVDLGGNYLAPGMIDNHMHGSAGVDVLEADHDALARLSEYLLGQGVTGYFATLVPTDEVGYQSALAEIGAYLDHERASLESRGRVGARILGVHFEGPFVSHSRCGALQRRHFRTYDGDPRSMELFTNTPAGFRGARLMTLAPETEGGLALIRELTGRSVRVFIGHTQADPETLDRAAEAGARHITHFPNALDPLHHRKPGAVGWGLVNREITMDCIADFHHVDRLMLRLMYQSKGCDGLALISDSILATGLGDGEYNVWGDRIAVRNGKTALVDGPAQGTIAGSVITLSQALRNIVSLGVPIGEAVRMASLVPARVAGVDREYGSIGEGKRADLVILGEDCSTLGGFVDGRAAGPATY